MKRAKRFKAWVGARRWRRALAISLWPLLIFVAASRLGVLDILTNMLFAQGVLLIIAGAFYLLSTHFKSTPLGGGDRHLIARSIGWAFIGIGVGSLLGGWSGGVKYYVGAYDAYWLAWLSLSVRTFTLYHQFRLLYLSLRLWAHQTPA